MEYQHLKVLFLLAMLLSDHLSKLCLKVQPLYHSNTMSICIQKICGITYGHKDPPFMHHIPKKKNSPLRKTNAHYNRAIRKKQILKSLIDLSLK